MEDLQSITALRAAYAQHTLSLAGRGQGSSPGAPESEAGTWSSEVRKTNFLTVVPSGGSSYIFPRVVGLDLSDKEIAVTLQDKAGVIINPGFQSGRAHRPFPRLLRAGGERS